MEDKVEEIAVKIKGWMKANRMGDLEEKPCFWSIYEIPSMSSKPQKHTPINSDNLYVEDLENSLKHLLECMSFSTHIKYFAVRLREKKGDPGTMNNFANPYYQKPFNHTSIGNIPQNKSNGNDILLMMIGMLNTMNENRSVDKEESQTLLSTLKIQNIENNHKFEMYKLMQKNRELEKENQSIGSNKGNFFKEFIGEIMPEIKEVIRYIAGNNTPYEEEDLSIEGGENKGEQVEDNDNKALLNNALSMLSTKVDHPEVLISKVAVIMAHSPDDETNTLLSMLQAKYNQIKNSKQNG